MIPFSVPGSDLIYELKLGETLLRFAAFDLAFFGNQCVGLYEKSTPDEFVDKAPHLKEYLHSCHPYCKALMGTVFSKIALDCVISEICRKEGVGLEALWTEKMAAPDPLGQEIFRRITDYKTGRAINQWTNLVRMQSYALSKMTFIYSGEGAQAATHKARKLHYDLLFMMTAAELGVDKSDMPGTEICSVPFLKQGSVIMKADANAPTQGTSVRTAQRGDASVLDQTAGVVINAMAGIKQPEEDDLEKIARKHALLPYPVYVPGGLKAIIDLEFDQMLDKGFYIQIDGNDRVRMRYSLKKEAAEKRAARGMEPDPETPLKDAPITTPITTPKAKPITTLKARPITPTEAVKETAAESEKAPVNGQPEAVPVPEKQPVEPENPGTEEITAAERRAARDMEDEPEPPQEASREAPPAAVNETAAEDEKGLSSGQAETTPVLEDLPAEPEISETGHREAEADNTGKVRMIIGMAEDPGRLPSKNRTLQEVNMRCNLIWMSMNMQTGWSITPQDASTWFRYLTRLRFGIGKGELTPDALDKFLDATQEVFKLLPEDRN